MCHLDEARNRHVVGVLNYRPWSLPYTVVELTCNIFWQGLQAGIAKANGGIGLRGFMSIQQTTAAWEPLATSLLLTPHIVVALPLGPFRLFEPSCGIFNTYQPRIGTLRVC